MRKNETATQIPEMELFENLGLSLRIAREFGGLSQAELARRARMAKSQVSRYESAKELPKLPSLARMLHELKTTPFAFFYTLHFLDELKAGRIVLLPPAETSSLSAAEHTAFSRLVEDVFALQRAIVDKRIASVHGNLSSRVSD